MPHTQGSHHPGSLNQRFWNWLAASMYCFPLFADTLRVLLGLTQPRFTAGVVGVVFNDQGEILVAEHAFHPRNAWGLPGGWLGARENPPAALIREMREELELSVEIICPLLIENGYFSKSHLDVAFMCRATGNVGELSFELLSYQWLLPTNLPMMLPFHRRAVDAALKFNAGLKSAAG